MKYFYRINDKADLLHKHLNRTGQIEVQCYGKDNSYRLSEVAIQTYPENYKETAESLFKMRFREEKINKIEEIIPKREK